MVVKSRVCEFQKMTTKTTMTTKSFLYLFFAYNLVQMTFEAVV